MESVASRRRGAGTVNVLEALARDGIDASAARDAVWRALDTHEGARHAYAALCRWTWRIMVERRLDEELRSWHRLLLDAAAKLAGSAAAAVSRPRARARLDPAAVAERLRALADIVRLSVDAAAASVPAELSQRAHVREILSTLADSDGEHVERERIREALGLGDANLSRVLTLMTANGLVERLPRGKVASFRATQRGLALVAAPDRKERERARAEMPALFVHSHFGAPKLPRFKPGTIIIGTAVDRQTEPVVHGPIDHEPTYTPQIVTRRWVADGNHRATKARDAEVAL
jgi:DNA-binding transcriptional ArsR family regulator